MEWVGPSLLADFKGNLPPEVKFTCPMARYRNVSFQIVAEAPVGAIWAFDYYIRLEQDAPWVKAPEAYNDGGFLNPLANVGSCIYAFRDLPVGSDIQMRVTHTSQDCSAVKLRVWMVQWADAAAGVSGVPMPPVSDPPPPREISTFKETIVAGYNWLANTYATTEVPPTEVSPPVEEPPDEDEVDMSRFRQLQNP